MFVVVKVTRYSTTTLTHIVWITLNYCTQKDVTVFDLHIVAVDKEVGNII